MVGITILRRNFPPSFPELNYVDITLDDIQPRLIILLSLISILLLEYYPNTICLFRVN